MRCAFITLAIATALVVVFDSNPSLAQAPAPAAAKAKGGGFSQPDPIDFNDHEGWASLFDGTTLKGWDGDTNYWRVENGAIVVESTCEKPTGTIYLVWQGGEAADFELKFEMRGDGGRGQQRVAVSRGNPDAESSGRSAARGAGDVSQRSASWDASVPVFPGQVEHERSAVRFRWAERI
jgi:hypothetical protein